MNETGVVELRNTKDYPFNDSWRTVPLAREVPGAGYFVLTEALESDGSVGDIEVTGKADNGFGIAFTGSARTAKVRYSVVAF